MSDQSEYSKNLNEMQMWMKTNQQRVKKMVYDLEIFMGEASYDKDKFHVPTYIMGLNGLMQKFSETIRQYESLLHAYEEKKDELINLQIKKNEDSV